MRTYPSQFSVSALLLALAALAVGILVAIGAASAHHPGSHGARLPDGQVRVEVAATVTDGCTVIEGVTPGVPEGLKAPAGAVALTVSLGRSAGACPQVVRALSKTAIVAAPKEAATVHLYVLNGERRLQATERVAIN